MLIISFAWTTGAFLAGRKTETRRFWSDDYARKFKKGDLVQAYDKNPRAGGKCVGIIRLTHDLYKEKLSEMTEEALEREGGLWDSVEEFVEMMGGADKKPWVVKFEVIGRKEAL